MSQEIAVVIIIYLTENTSQMAVSLALI